MRVLAVIPARAGSKGIPNKNIRLLKGHPLVWYAINNAKKSHWITDIVVSTDSYEVDVIARQMGVSVHWRAAELCADDVTLDAVIYDACKDEKYDYIVTMQPTSPTLQTDTLDSAVGYAIDGNWDTVISAVNRPHLSWREDEGKKRPNYEKRLNRQYLPANYIETGAFMVSKASAVTEESRIGREVDVYEISENEAVDIDTFGDLKNAESILSGQKIGIYVNGNNNRGLGHVCRVLEIADEFYTKPDIYYDINQTDREVFGDTAYRLIGVNGIGELLDCCRKEQYDLFINDILSTSIDYMIALREAMPYVKIINFEDDGEGIYKADLVVNALYHESPLEHVKNGEKYYIAPKLYLFYDRIDIRDTVSKVFISFGGADPQNYSERLLEIASKEKYNNIQFTVVLGRAKKNAKEILENNRKSNIEVLYDVKNMPEIMHSCDIALTSRGRTGYELAILGIPTIAMAQNRREEKHRFVSGENGFTYLGLNPSDHVIDSMLDMYIHMSKEERIKYQQLLLKSNLVDGRKRVMGLINSL